MTFSSTVRESKSAADWKIMPISRLMAIRSLFDIDTKSRPSYRTWPDVGVRSPTRFFINTVLPEPDWPMMRFVLPLANVASMPLRTSLSPKDLCRFFICIIFVWMGRGLDGRVFMVS